MKQIIPLEDELQSLIDRRGEVIAKSNELYKKIQDEQRCFTDSERQLSRQLGIELEYLLNKIDYIRQRIELRKVNERMNKQGKPRQFAVLFDDFTTTAKNRIAEDYIGNDLKNTAIDVHVLCVDTERETSDDDGITILQYVTVRLMYDNGYSQKCRLTWDCEDAKFTKLEYLS